MLIWLNWLSRNRYENVLAFEEINKMSRDIFSQTKFANITENKKYNSISELAHCNLKAR
jgi:hypothetical protein